MGVTVSLAARRDQVAKHGAIVKNCRVRDHRLGHGHLLRQDRHPDPEQDEPPVGRSGEQLAGDPDSRSDAGAGWPRDAARAEWTRSPSDAVDPIAGRRRRGRASRSATPPRAPSLRLAAQRHRVVAPRAGAPARQIHFSSGARMPG